MSIKYVVDLLQTGALDLDPSFQRRSIWNRDQKSRFIETLLMGLPVPSFYFAEEPHGRLSVIDGKQRLLAILEFMNGSLKLSSIGHAYNLNGMSFDEVPLPNQRRFLTRGALRVIVLREDSPDWAKRTLFVRLNTAGEELTRQEIRNALFPGRLNDALNEMANAEFLLRQFSNAPHSHSRMGDVELPLRFLALSEEERFPERLTADLLDRFMSEHWNISTDLVVKYVQRFRRSLSACEAIWGDNAFKRFQRGRWSGPPTISIFDVEMVACSQVSDRVIQEAVGRKNSLHEMLERAFNHSAFESKMPLSPKLAQKRARILAAALEDFSRGLQ
ncbi:DUF262 domain-containing protein [Micromonospora sp. RTGN7]|uniref:DUF262 domain-containing protein n=1 Tax=Micromonospora sp. RTGN7 TaxID=3016526 RepID=UPI0029FEF6C2|nr:DUF262 domain-containing protein [Micromonospora sp. RTGN7]